MARLFKTTVKVIASSVHSLASPRHCSRFRLSATTLQSGRPSTGWGGPGAVTPIWGPSGCRSEQAVTQVGHNRNPSLPGKQRLGQQGKNQDPVSSSWAPPFSTGVRPPYAYLQASGRHCRRNALAVADCGKSPAATACGVPQATSSPPDGPLPGPRSMR